ncbi:MAG: discoidin domain-containing protein, partial [Planctomycetes bacterium]|nr:discoidin domain-containing protein [Planctomycetota bacterium]
MLVYEQFKHRWAAIDLFTRLSFFLALTIVSLAARRAVGQDVSNSATIVPNIALTAKVSASSEHDDRYRAENAIDGIVPIGLCKEDLGTAWATRGVENGFKGWFRFEWEKPMDVAEIVYFGRTAQLIEECFRNYEVYVDDAPEPVATGTLQKVDGPQRITLAKVRARSLKLNFLDSYTSQFNPGASEIAVFAKRVMDRQLQQMLHGES